MPLSRATYEHKAASKRPAFNDGPCRDCDVTQNVRVEYGTSERMHHRAM